MSDDPDYDRVHRLMQRGQKGNDKMSGTKHTPGPWRVHNYENVSLGFVIDDSNQDTVAKTYGNGPESLANARLISAAPIGAGLAESVLKAVRVPGVCRDMLPNWEEWTVIVTLAREFKAKMEVK